MLLENALMARSLDAKEPTPTTLFRSLDLDGLRVTLNGQGAAAARPILDAVRRELEADAVEQEAPTIRLTSSTLSVGGFDLARVAPVERLLSFAVERFNWEEAIQRVAACALTYDAVYAETRHIGPPQVVYDDFHRWGVRNEGFASPFNARLLGKDGSGFYSLFPHVDVPFGGRGSFYRTAAPTHDGAWAIDPPFITQSLARAEAIMKRWLEGGDAPPMIWIGPSSYEVRLPQTRHVRLRAHTHFYEALDGALHPLPIDVSVILVGEMAAFDAEAIRRGYLP